MFKSWDDYHVLGQVLEDDETPFGGKEHADERLADIVEDMIIHNDNGILDRINEVLQETGIKPIRIREESF